MDPSQSLQMAASSGKKKKSKGTKARGPGAMPKSRGTGFEEYYCDPPISPDEYKEEHEDVYAPRRPFHTRIEACIQRYRARRRLDSARTNFFNNYLLLGGIDFAPRQFQSTSGIDKDDDDDDLEPSDNDRIRNMKANDVIFHGAGADERYYNPSEPEHWKVDFTGVVSGYLSEWLPKASGGQDKFLLLGIEVVMNFLKYIVAHDVCPEYNEDIRSALAVCKKAQVELPVCGQLWLAMPGDFNTAARALFCTGESILDFDNFDASEFDGFNATVVFNMNLLLWLAKDKERQNSLVSSQPIHVVHTTQQVFELVEIPETEYPGHPRVNGWVAPDHKQVEKYNGIKIKPKTDGSEKTEVPGLKPVGILRLKPTEIIEGWDNGDHVQRPVDWIGETEDLFIETEILELLEPGMKLKLAVCELNCQIKFIKEVKQIYPSFYVFPPQELMVRFKHPMLSERPGPSVENPEEDETAVDDD